MHIKKKTRINLVLLQLIIIILILCISNNDIAENINQNGINLYQNQDFNQEVPPMASDVYPWITNGGFNDGSDWYSTISGDSSDHDSEISGGLAHYKIIGETKTFSFLSYPKDDTINPEWNMTLNPEIPYYPGDFDGASTEMVGIINGSGMWAYHETGSGDRNLVSANFYHDVEMPVDMEGYEIVSADAQVTYNASCWPTKIETEADAPTSFMYYDHVKFYIDVSDLNNNSINRLAENRTTTWGDTEANYEVFYPNHTTEESAEEFQIYALTQALATNGYNFRIRVGFDINCEPSGGTANDQDIWDSIYVNKVNVTFQYRKKIDQFNELSWNQAAAQLPDNIQINNATLKFKYNISTEWPADSPNSEFRILIDGNPHSETFKLSDLNSTLREVNEAGINIKPLIEYAYLTPNKDVNLSIQLYIADEFLLDYNISIFIDDVSLDIGYESLYPEIPTLWKILLNGQDLTGDPQIEVPLGSTLNITVDYTNESYEFVTGAIVTLNRLGETDYFDQDDIYDQYNLSVNVDDQLLGGLNNLDLRVRCPGYVGKSDTVGVIVRKINTTISSLTGDEIIIVPEAEAYLEIQLYDEDSESTIKDATVAYSSPLLGSGNLEDANDDGIYNTTIENVPEGVHNVEISVYASDNYEFNPFSLDINANSSLLIQSDMKVYFNGVDYSADPSIILPTGSTLNISVEYTNQTGDFIPDAAVVLNRAGYPTFLMDPDLEYNQYTVMMNVDANFSRGLNELSILGEKLGYVDQDKLLSISIRKRLTSITTNIEDNTKNIFPEDNVSVSLSIIDLDFGGTIENLTVTYSNPDLGSGLLTDSNNDGIYDVQFVNILEGHYPIEIKVIQHENYTFNDLVVTINSLSSLLENSSFLIYLNGNETTIDPSIELPIGSELNITVKFLDTLEEHISGAIARIGKLGYLDSLEENQALHQYSIIFKVDDILARGNNILNLYLKKIGYIVQISDIRVIVRQIRTEISSESGSNRLDIEPGEVATLRIHLQNLDYGIVITSATVTFTSSSPEIGSGRLTDENGEGIYEHTWEDVPEGVYSIVIEVFVNDSFIFDNYEYTIAVQRDPNEVLTERVILIVVSTGVFGLMTYVTIYQTKLKYPEEVRKLRKLRSSIKKGKRVRHPVEVLKRHEILADKLREDLVILGLKKTDLESENIAMFMTEEDLAAQKAQILEAERLKNEEIRLAKEKAEQERIKKEQAAKEKAEKERLKREKAEQARIEKEKAAKEKAERDRLKKEQAAKEKAEKERLKREKTEQARIEKEKAEEERLKKEKVAHDQSEQEHPSQEGK